MADNIETVRAMLAAFAVRDIEGVLRYLHPDVEFTPFLARLRGEPPVYRGHDGIRRYFRDMADAWPDLELEGMQMQQAGDAVTVIGSVRAETPNGELRADAVWTWRLRDGLLIEGRVHGDEGPARAALGLPPSDARDARRASGP